MRSRSQSLIGRDDERHQLQQLAATGQRQLALVTGRRRVGKTWLLTHTWPPDQYFLFTASRTTPELNRRQLLNDLNGFLKTNHLAEDFPTWRTILNLLLDLQLNKPLTVILDEFQYLAEGETGLAEVASELNAAWERPRPKQPLVLVLAGSAVSTMEGLAGGGAPLYGRFNLQLKLTPLDYWHASELAPFDSLRDRARLYGTFGGMPRYLAAIDTSATLEENIIRLMLSPQGEVRLLLETTLDQEEGLRDIASYNAILRAIASGSTIQNEIAQRAGLKNDTALRSKIDKLIELGYLGQHRNIGASPNTPYRYRLNDPALRFHQRFVQPNTSLLEREPAAEVWKHIRRHLPGYMGLEFEQITQQAYGRLRVKRGLPLLSNWGSWQGQDRNRHSLEVDVVAPTLDGGILTGAIKWQKNPAGIELHHDHLRMLDRAATAGQKWAHSALEPTSPLLYVSASGFEPGFRDSAERSDHPVVLLDLKEMYSL